MKSVGLKEIQKKMFQPMMLYSFINMKLRDQYASLDELCEEMNIDKTFLIDVLGAVGFEYNASLNKFW